VLLRSAIVLKGKRSLVLLITSSAETKVSSKVQAKRKLNAQYI